MSDADAPTPSGETAPNEAAPNEAAPEEPVVNDPLDEIDAEFPGANDLAPQPDLAADIEPEELPPGVTLDQFREMPAMYQQQIRQQIEMDRQIQERIEEMTAELSEEYGEENITELLIEAAYSPESAEFLLEAEEAIQATIERVGRKTPFYLHTEQNGDQYILRALKPGEFKISWLQVLDGDAEVFEMYGPAILKKAMVYPSFADTDWDWSGDGINQPMSMTDRRLVGQVLEREVAVDENQDVEFAAEDVPNAAEAARKNAGKSGF